MKALIRSVLSAAVGVVVLTALIIPLAGPSRANQKLQEAAQALADAKDSRDPVPRLTHAIRAFEASMTDLRSDLRGAVLREQALQKELDSKSGALSDLVAAIQTIEQDKDRTLLLHPAGALASARAGLLAADMAPALNDRVASVRTELAELAELTEARKQAQSRLQQALSQAQTARTELIAALKANGTLPDQSDIDELLEVTMGLSELSETFPPLPDDLRPAAEIDLTNLPLPVSGTVLYGYDEPDATGLTRPGFTVATAAEALVTAPAASTVRFAGPLLDFGMVVVLEPVRDALLILAGLETLYVSEDQVVAEGAPLGLMGDVGEDENTIAPERGNPAGTLRPETLYIELRQSNTPVDPAEWFTVRKDG
ncbi:murein hydrolase activator EnvC family protein [Qingshengfaniella alkalisoli]|uniref:Peptidoglycan DD-metalloendopeptidase family protein n=1 Tax=Qingshengfaniella alkalisoli TaxID=2599296 RepID=A0A5B8ICF0_9RHOB|nr:peptidoglycan DD-metalloendopeptidase family protein [Qingshengfaniella alkalisoli]QDY71256.1 peptidoglycan DD-metalloendopeptidase family protein [Qingshengfaniella alkalisoli]